MPETKFDPDITRRNDAAYWAAALALAIRAGDTSRAELAQDRLRQLGVPLRLSQRKKGGSRAH